MALPNIPPRVAPFTVVEYFPSPDVSGYHDPRHHAVSLAFVVPVAGDCKPTQEALDLAWFTPDRGRQRAGPPGDDRWPGPPDPPGPRPRRRPPLTSASVHPASESHVAVRVPRAGRSRTRSGCALTTDSERHRPTRSDGVSGGVVTVVGDLVEDVVVWVGGPVTVGTDNPAAVRRSPGGSAANVAAAVARAGGRRGSSAGSAATRPATALGRPARRSRRGRARAARRAHGDGRRARRSLRASGRCSPTVAPPPSSRPIDSVVAGGHGRPARAGVRAADGTSGRRAAGGRRRRARRRRVA